MLTTASDHRSNHRAQRWSVIALSSLLVLSACTTTTTITAVEGAPATESTPPEDTSTDPQPANGSEDGDTNGVDGSDSSATATTPPDPTAPTTTDVDDARFDLEGTLPLTTAEVNELIAFIETDTGRPFLRPPSIVAQTNDEFLEGLADDLDEFITDADVTVRTLQALGLTTRGVAEVSQAFQNLLLSPEGILGYYDPEVDKLYVPVDSLGDDEFRGLLVHELTHALDGQYADLNVLDALSDVAEETGDYEPIVALQAVVEGRASSVQNRWLAANGVEQEVPDDLGAIADVPPAMVLSISIPYAFGEQFIETKGGAANTWDDVENPPASSEAFIIPGTSPNEVIIDVATPAADGPILQEVVYGASDIFVWLLGDSLEPNPAFIFPTINAIDGWAGGRSVLWGDENESCMRIAIAGDTADDLAEIQQVLELWADGHSDRVVESNGDLVVVTGCAPYVP